MTAYQVVVCELGNVTRLNIQILECLGLGVDDLVQVLALNKILREGVPPEQSVHDLGDRLHDGLGDVDVGSLLEDFLVNHGSNLSHGVLLGAIKLKGRAGK